MAAAWSNSTSHSVPLLGGANQDPFAKSRVMQFRTSADEGRTVLFSSHLLDEVEQVADYVTMISRGRIALSAPLEIIKESHRSLDEAFVARLEKVVPGGGQQLCGQWFFREISQVALFQL